MAITSSVVKVGHAQKDGRRYVLEIHSDGSGECYRIEYLGDETTAQATADARVPFLNELLAQRELEQKINVDANPVPFRFQTAGQFIQRLRDYYKTLDRDELARLAQWITKRIDAGDVTITQLRNAWGLTLTQWNNLETKMRNLRSSIENVSSAVGE